MRHRYRFPIKGTFYYDAAEAFTEQRLAYGQRLIIRAEPDNAHDANALQIWLPGDDQAPERLVGYVPRQLARLWQPLWHAHTDYSLTLTMAGAKGKLLRLECECTLSLSWPRHLLTRFWILWLRLQNAFKHQHLVQSTIDSNLSQSDRKEP